LAAEAAFTFTEKFSRELESFSWTARYPITSMAMD